MVARYTSGDRGGDCPGAKREDGGVGLSDGGINQRVTQGHRRVVGEVSQGSREPGPGNGAGEENGVRAAASGRGRKGESLRRWRWKRAKLGRVKRPVDAKATEAGVFPLRALGKRRLERFTKPCAVACRHGLFPRGDTFVRRLRFDVPVVVKMNGRTQRGVIVKPISR